MKKSHLYGAVCAFVFSLISIPSHAALIDNGDGLIYDTVLDITWAQPEPTTPPPGGFRTWDDANDWAAGLTLGGVSGWRLPYASVAAGVGPLLDLPVDCTMTSEVDCRDNEMGYMFYYNLSGTFDEGILTSGDPDLALFPDLDTAAPYWTGTRRNTDGDPEPIPDTAWLFYFASGEWRDSEMVRESKLTWYVHEGNVGAIPVPAADVVVNFGSLPLFAWMNDADWLKLNNSSPDRITTGDMDGNGEDDVIADFASTLGGIFVKFNLGGWTQLANVASEQMTAGDLDNNGQDDVVIDAGAAGLFARMNNTSWLKLANASPEQVVVGDMDNNGADDVIGDFGVDGIFVKRNLGAWVKLHNSNPEDMTIGNLDATAGDDLVVDFAGSLGLQARMNDSSWLKLHNGSPDVMTTGDVDGNGADDVLAGFGSTIGGFWQKLNLGGWSQLNANSPDDLVTADVTGNGEDDIVAAFGSTIGGLFIKRDQGGWVKQHNTSPDSMAPGELD